MAVERPMPSMPYPGVPPKRGKDHGPSQADIDAANAGQLAPKGAEKFLQRLARNWAVRLGLIAGVGYGAYQVPTIQRAVDSVYHDTLQKLGLEAVVVPTTFDNKADKGVIGDNNILPLSPGEISSLPSFDEQGPVFLSPIKNNPSSKGVSTYDKTMNDNIGLSKEVSANARKEGIRDKIEFPSFPTDTVLVAPIDGYAFSMLEDDLPGTKDDPLLRGITIEFLDPKTNILYFVNIAADYSQGTSIENQRTMENLISNVPRQSAENRNGKDWKKGLNIQRGTPILKLTKETRISMFIQGGRDGSLFEAKGRVPGNIRFLTDALSNKLIALK